MVIKNSTIPSFRITFAANLFFASTEMLCARDEAITSYRPGILEVSKHMKRLKRTKKPVYQNRSVRMSTEL